MNIVRGRTPAMGAGRTAWLVRYRVERAPRSETPRQKTMYTTTRAANARTQNTTRSLSRSHTPRPPNKKEGRGKPQLAGNYLSQKGACMHWQPHLSPRPTPDADTPPNLSGGAATCDAAAMIVEAAYRLGTNGISSAEPVAHMQNAPMNEDARARSSARCCLTLTPIAAGLRARPRR